MHLNKTITRALQKHFPEFGKFLSQEIYSFIHNCSLRHIPHYIISAIEKVEKRELTLIFLKANI